MRALRWEDAALMATLDRIRLEFYLPEDEPHESVPRVDDELVVAIRNDRPGPTVAGSIAFRVIQVFERCIDAPGVNSRRAEVWADRIETESGRTVPSGPLEEPDLTTIEP